MSWNGADAAVSRPAVSGQPRSCRGRSREQAGRGVARRPSSVIAQSHKSQLGRQRGRAADPEATRPAVAALARVRKLPWRQARRQQRSE